MFIRKVSVYLHATFHTLAVGNSLMKDENRFIKKFSEKTENELREIVLRDKHVPKAKIAAEFLLKNKTFQSTYPNLTQNNNESNKKLNKDNSFTTDLRLFLKTLSYREFLSIISSVSLFMSLIFLRDFYSENDFIYSTNSTFSNILIFSLIIASNHILYKLEHKRSNIYFGRFIIDIVFILSYFLASLLLGHKDYFDIGEFFIFIILTAILELFFSLLKRIIKIF